MTTYKKLLKKIGKNLVGLLLAFLTYFWCITDVLADKDDTLNFIVSSSYTHDSNLFRLPSNVQPSVAGAERSDNILRNLVGISIDKPYSLQRFQFDYAYIDTQYDNASFLDFKASNYKGAWLWALTPSLNGVLSADRVVELVPFQDLRSGNNAQSRNVRTKQTQILNFDFSPHNTLHFIGGYNKLDVKNSQTFLPETSFKLDSIEVGLKYVFPSASYVSFVSRKSDGQNQETNFSQQIGKTFEERQQMLSLFWLATGKTRILSNLGYIDRVDNSFSIRDYSGFIGDVNLMWDITGKTNLSIGISRKLSSFQTADNSYYVADSLFVNPTWNATSKITVRANAQVGQRRFKGNGPLPNVINREDTRYSYGVGADWSPRRSFKFGLNLQHDEISSNVKSQESSDNTISLSGRLLF